MTTPSKLPSLVRLPNTATAQEILEITLRDGGCIVEQHTNPDLLRRFNAEIDVLIADRRPNQGIVDTGGLADFLGHRTKRLANLPAVSDTFSEIVLDDRLLEWAKLSLDWGTDFLLNAAQVIEIGPGEPAQFLHRDEILWPQLDEMNRELMVSCMHALTDFNEELGATRVVPGTNHAPKAGLETFDVARDSVPAIMKAGDALFFTGSVVHGGGQNKSENQLRRGMSVTFSLGWLRPEEAYNLSVPLERAKQLPPRLRELMGFASYRAPVGYSYQFDLADPYTKLFGEERPSAPPASGSFSSTPDANM